jgi:hypothetical protein
LGDAVPMKAAAAAASPCTAFGRSVDPTDSSCYMCSRTKSLRCTSAPSILPDCKCTLHLGMQSHPHVPQFRCRPAVFHNRNSPACHNCTHQLPLGKLVHSLHQMTSGNVWCPRVRLHTRAAMSRSQPSVLQNRH